MKLGTLFAETVDVIATCICTFSPINSNLQYVLRIIVRAIHFSRPEHDNHITICTVENENVCLPCEFNSSTQWGGHVEISLLLRQLSFMGLNRLEDGEDEQPNGDVVDGYLPKDAWHRLARRAEYCFRTAPSFHYM